MCHAFNKNHYMNFKSGKIKEKDESHQLLEASITLISRTIYTGHVIFTACKHLWYRILQFTEFYNGCSLTSQLLH